MFPDLIKIGDFTVHTYGVLVALGLIASYITAIYFAKRENLDTKKVENIIIFAVIGGLIGARIAYVIEHHDQMKSFLDYIAIWKGGIDWFGGFIGGIITALIFIKKYNIPIWKAGDIAGISIIIGHAFGRLGCTCAGCCYGKPVPDDSIFKDLAIKFPNHPDTVAPPGIALYPTQPAEAIGNFIIFGILFLFYRNKKFDGQIFALYLIFYGFERFLLEFWRGVTPPVPYINLTWNQIITLGMVLAGIIILIIRSKRQIETV
ncbi:prolipoprotein diacylglyceryl transferase [Hydrogenothermus marinus]|uniref:Phosphatidylglycerol--prolipoprotein diacylglyceryl transferase n=1 Tax=Hydrogenothermus marinus TaxID=133270 RepID=A0A3M0BMY5_9AQUI|nr:prolipoprotein diacylglyceryl transferase [Hydrogenothermus marinus]RMA97629.1 prolipoprotein diacylglyceryl transferase [Hydrogenothermus marinus]